jgi:hypothetical protein
VSRDRNRPKECSANVQAPDELVTIATFRDVFEADFVKTMLDLEGVPCLLESLDMVLLRWDYSNAVGGIKIKALAQDAERARQLLREKPIRPDSTRLKISDPEYDLACPRCSSLDVRYEKYSRCVFFVSWLILGFPIIIPARRFKCRACRHRWKWS